MKLLFVRRLALLALSLYLVIVAAMATGGQLLTHNLDCQVVAPGELYCEVLR